MIMLPHQSLANITPLFPKFSLIFYGMVSLPMSLETEVLDFIESFPVAFLPAQYRTVPHQPDFQTRSLTPL